jgi:hypothetical protein
MWEIVLNSYRCGLSRLELIDRENTRYSYNRRHLQWPSVVKTIKFRYLLKDHSLYKLLQTSPRCYEASFTQRYMPLLEHYNPQQLFLEVLQNWQHCYKQYFEPGRVRKRRFQGLNLDPLNNFFGEQRPRWQMLRHLRRKDVLRYLVLLLEQHLQGCLWIFAHWLRLWPSIYLLWHPGRN